LALAFSTPEHDAHVAQLLNMLTLRKRLRIVIQHWKLSFLASAEDWKRSSGVAEQFKGPTLVTRAQWALLKE
jgi:hypothetical protein